MAAARWYFARDKQKIGPFAALEFKQLATFGLLKPGEFVLAEGSSKWVEASSVPWLFPMAGQKKYALKLLGQVRGPYLVDQIRAALATQEITLETLAQADDSEPWTPLRQLDEFKNFVPTPISPSRAQLYSGTLEIEEATLHLAGKSGDVLAKLISNLMDMQRTHANNPALSENIETTIKVLKAKREEIARSAEARIGAGSGLR
jgi:hypothetical protein